MYQAKSPPFPKNLAQERRRGLSAREATSTKISKKPVKIATFSRNVAKTAGNSVIKGWGTKLETGELEQNQA